MFGSDSSDDDDDEEEEEEEEEEVEEGKEDVEERRTDAGTTSVAHMKEIKGIGGGRGLFAAVALDPGDLVLSEIPSFDWAQLGDGDINNGDPEYLIDVVINMVLSAKALAAAATLYPYTLVDADSTEIQEVKERLSDEQIDKIKAIKADIEGIHNIHFNCNV